MRTRYIVSILIVIVLLIVTAVIFYGARSEPPEGYPVRDDIILETVEKPRRMSGDENGCVGPAGFEWCPSQNRCMRTWEEYCEEFDENYRGDDNAKNDTLTAEGDTGENPPAESENWPLYYSGVYKFYFQYPQKYHVVENDDQAPHAVVHLMHDQSGQSYDLTIEGWEQEELAEIEKRTEDDLPFFAIVEHPQTEKFISFTCWTDDVAQDCKNIYLTVGFQQDEARKN